MVVSLTIENLDADIVERLRNEAQRRGVDVGVVASELLKEGLDTISRAHVGQTHHDLDALAGTWSNEEANAFLSAVTDLRQID